MRYSKLINTQVIEMPVVQGIDLWHEIEPYHNLIVKQDTFGDIIITTRFHAITPNKSKVFFSTVIYPHIPTNADRQYTTHAEALRGHELVIEEIGFRKASDRSPPIRAGGKSKPVDYEYLGKGVPIGDSMKPVVHEHAKFTLFKPGFETNEVSIKTGPIQAEAPSCTCDGINLVPGNRGHG